MLPTRYFAFKRADVAYFEISHNRRGLFRNMPQPSLLLFVCAFTCGHNAGQKNWAGRVPLCGLNTASPLEARQCGITTPKLQISDIKITNDGLQISKRAKRSLDGLRAFRRAAWPLPCPGLISAFPIDFLPDSQIC